MGSLTTSSDCLRLSFMRQQLSLLLIALLPLAWMAGCDKGQAKEGDEPTVVRLGYFANLTHAQAVLGVSSGDFAAAVAPATIETRIFNAGPSLMEAMIAGEIDIAYVGPGPAIAAHTATGGQDISVISGAAANGVLIVAREGYQAKSLAELAAARIATPQAGNTQDISARHYLHSVLKHEDLSNVLPIANAEQLSLFQRGEMDAAWVPEPWASLLISQAKARVIAQEKDLWPSGEFATTIVVASRVFAQRHPQTIARFLAAHRKWTSRLQQNPAGQLTDLKAALFALTRKRLPDGVLESAIVNVRFTDDPLPESVKTMAQWTFDLGFMKRAPQLDGLFEVPTKER